MQGRHLTFFLVFSSFMIAIFAGSFAAAQQTSEEMLRRKFLKARQQMRTVPRTQLVPASAPTPTPTPVPAPESAEEPPTAPAVPAPPTAPAVATPTPAPPPLDDSLPILPDKLPPLPPAEEPPTTELPPSPRKVTPTPLPTPRERPLIPDRRTEAPPRSDLTVQKSGFQEEKGEVIPPEKPKKRGLFGGGGPKYKYLTPAVRAAIDNARVKRNRWKYVIVHNSGTRQGSAKAYEYYHRRVRKMQNGLAYHFVIGNGKGAGMGQIEIGNRWLRQINGGHVASDYLNNIAIGICLTGDYNRDRPPAEQLEALEELTNYLRKRVGKINGKLSVVKAHRQINPKPTDCPGDRFPYNWLSSRFR